MHDSVIESSWLEKISIVSGDLVFESICQPSHKTEPDWLKFDHDSVFESIDSKTSHQKEC